MTMVPNITEYSYILENNPDDEYFRKKKKMIKKNNGYCIGVPKTEEWKCPCKPFREKQEEGWCGEGLYYKRFIGPDANNTNDTKEE